VLRLAFPPGERGRPRQQPP